MYLVAAMPGRHSGDQVHKVKKTAAPSFDILRTGKDGVRVEVRVACVERPLGVVPFKSRKGATKPTIKLWLCAG